MAESAASTGYGVVSQIALEQAVPKAQRIYDDPLAVQMLPPLHQAMTMVMSMKLLRAPMARMLEKYAPGIADSILSRKRAIDDALVDSVKAGINTVVILGAGLDTLAYRHPELTTLRFYEVDLPEIIRYKQKKVRQIYQKLPANVTYVPIDFETQTLDAVLTTQGYSLDRETLFVWEGVTQYLTEAGVRATFEFLAKASAGSRLIFTYVLKDFIDGVDTLGLDTLYKRMRVSSQLWKFGLNSADVAGFIGAYGWQVIEQVGAQEYRQRYVNPVGRHEAVSDLERTVYAQKV
ncbi:MAG: SAM-dependent methyltransferase [Chloroflexi bacterium]|nr:SAM-dependent methyltransferase [Chloroflexota bacterium]